ncbi:uncharacterized protein LOC134755432 [Cydia strobilella]|uniref:uncharacterized protein LOC134755432 n=1 Tax=Cydia strobilella TaxID=1100964 RepID=UPI00300417CC
MKVSCIAMIKLIQLLFIYFIQHTICAGIEIRIEADDAIKILNTFVMSPIYKSITNDFRKSSDYNNPYHPEDDILSNNGVMSSTQTTTESPEDAKLETDNKKYSGIVSEDELVDTLDEPSINNATIPDNEFRQNDTSILEIVDKNNDIPKMNEGDIQDYQPLKRRFSVLKG